MPPTPALHQINSFALHANASADQVDVDTGTIGKSKSIVFQELRARISALEGLNQNDSFPFSGLPGGLPRGCLVEIFGPGKTEATTQILVENPALRTAWLEAKLSAFPIGIRQRQVNLEKIFFIEAGTESAWAAATILRAKLFPILIYNAPYGDERELRRFQLLTEQANSTMILLSETPAQNSWPIQVSLELRGRKLSVVRKK